MKLLIKRTLFKLLTDMLLKQLHLIKNETNTKSKTPLKNSYYFYEFRLLRTHVNALGDILCFSLIILKINLKICLPFY